MADVDPHPTPTEPPLGDFLLAADFTGSDPRGRLRRDRVGARQYAMTGGWDFDENELLEAPADVSTAFRATLPGDRIARRVFFTRHQYRRELDVSVSITFDSFDGTVSLRVRDDYFVTLTDDGRFGLAKNRRRDLQDLHEKCEWVTPFLFRQAFVPSYKRAPNRLRAILKDGRVTAYLNGTLAFDFAVGDSESASVELFACGGKSGATIVFDRFEVRDPVVPAPFEGLPVTIAVNAKDHLVTEGGAPSGESSWTFWLRAPSAWAAAPDLDARVLRVARRIYDDMNRVTRERGEEAVTYVLRDVAARVLTGPEEAGQPWAGKTLYELKEDGSALVDAPRARPT